MMSNWSLLREPGSDLPARCLVKALALLMQQVQ